MLAPVQIKIGFDNGPATPDPRARGATAGSCRQAVAHGTRVVIDDALLGHRYGAHGRRSRLCGNQRQPACSSMLGMSSGRAPPWPRWAPRPTRMIFGVELDDARSEIVDLFEDTVQNRLLWEGSSADRSGGALRDLGFDGPWGVEIRRRHTERRRWPKPSNSPRVRAACCDQSGTLTQAPLVRIDSTSESATRDARRPSSAPANVDGLPWVIESIHSWSSMR